MEIKKSYKADLERRRPYVFAASLVAVTLLFVGALFVPYRDLGTWIQEIVEDYDADLDIKPKQNDMIAADVPQEEAKKMHEGQSEKVNKVETATDLLPEKTGEDTEEKAGTDEGTDEKKDDDTPAPINLNNEEEIKIAEQLPQYPGGAVEFMKWLTATLKYPDEALQRKIEGRVMVSFIVEKDGSLSAIKVEKGINKLLDNEALRVMRLMPKWTPGSEKGKPCRSKVAIPIVFEI